MAGTAPTKKADENDPAALTAEDVQKQIDEAVAAAVAKAQADTATAVAADIVAKLKGDTGDDDATDLDPTIAKAVADAVAVEKAERDKLAKEVADLRKAEGQRIFKAKAETLSHIGKADDIAEVLEAVAGSVPEAYERLTGLLDAANARAAENPMLKEFGTTAGADVTGDPSNAIAKAVDAAKAADASLSDGDALAKALAADPALYAAYRDQFRR